MKSLTVKTVAGPLAAVLAGMAFALIINHQIQAENEAANADIQAIIDKECARQKKSGQITPRCLDSDQ